MDPRLAPIEKPDGRNMRFVYWMMRRTFGKVLTHTKVVWAGMPTSLLFSYETITFQQHGIGLAPELRRMVGMLASESNGCGSCVDLAQSEAQVEHDDRIHVSNLGE